MLRRSKTRAARTRIPLWRRIVRALNIVIPVLAISVVLLGATAPKSLAAVDSVSMAKTGQVHVTLRDASVLERAMYQANSVLPAMNEGNDGGGGALPICDTSNESADNDPNLTINRWGDSASTLHTRLDANAFSDLAQKVQRNGVDSTMLNFGNGVWSVSTALVETSNRFCVADGVGVQIDHSVGEIGKAIWGDSSTGNIIILLLFAGTLLMFAFRALRSGNANWKPMLRFALTAGLFMVMINGAMNSGNGSYGTFSPGWFVSTTNTAVSDMTSAVTGSITNEMIKSNSVAPSQYVDTANKANCENYLAALRQNYQNAYGTSAFQQNAAALPLTLDTMWQHSGLTSFVNTQYGTDNAYAWNVYCKQLDWNSGISGADVAKNIGLTGISNAKSSVMLQPGSDNTAQDIGMMAWAACKWNGGSAGSTGSWSIVSGWDQVNNSSHGDNGKLLAQDCANMVTGSDDGTNTAANWEDGSDQIADGTKDVAVTKGNNPADFIGSVHGYSSASSSLTALVYAGSSLGVGAVFCGLSLVVLLLKLCLLGAGVMLLGAALVDLLPGREHSVLMKVVRSLLGFILVACGYSALLALVGTLSLAISEVGAALPIGDLGRIVWGGLAPIGAIFMLKMLWSKLVKAPDPLSLHGAQSWGKSAMNGSLGTAMSVAGGEAAGSWFRGRRDKSDANGSRLSMDQSAPVDGGTEATRQGGMGIAADAAEGEAVQGTGRGRRATVAGLADQQVNAGRRRREQIAAGSSARDVAMAQALAESGDEKVQGRVAGARDENGRIVGVTRRQAKHNAKLLRLHQARQHYADASRLGKLGLKAKSVGGTAAKVGKGVAAAGAVGAVGLGLATGAPLWAGVAGVAVGGAAARRLVKGGRGYFSGRASRKAVNERSAMDFFAATRAEEVLRQRQATVGESPRESQDEVDPGPARTGQMDPPAISADGATQSGVDASAVSTTDTAAEDQVTERVGGVGDTGTAPADDQVPLPVHAEGAPSIDTGTVPIEQAPTRTSGQVPYGNSGYTPGYAASTDRPAANTPPTPTAPANAGSVPIDQSAARTSGQVPYGNDGYTAGIGVTPAETPVRTNGANGAVPQPDSTPIATQQPVMRHTSQQRSVSSPAVPDTSSTAVPPVADRDEVPVPTPRPFHREDSE